MTVAAPALAFHGGGGFGGMHGGGGFGGGGFRGTGAFGPRAGAPFVHPRFVSHNFAFRDHRRFNNFAFVGAPFFGVGYGDTCWRRVWTNYGWQWANICYDYGY